MEISSTLVVSSKSPLPSSVPRLSSEDSVDVGHALDASNIELQEMDAQLIHALDEIQSLNVTLQSVNDALHASNMDLRSELEAVRVRLVQVEQMLNLVDVGTALVNRHLALRNFNATASRFLSVGKEAIGKSIARLSHDLGSTELVELCREALATGNPVERILASGSGESVLIRIRDVELDASEDGLMLTFAVLDDALTPSRSRLA
jgi:nitrogen fixation/metabolism regulation signal transduction histidine kinase